MHIIILYKRKAYTIITSHTADPVCCVNQSIITVVFDLIFITLAQLAKNFSTVYIYITRNLIKNDLWKRSRFNLASGADKLFELSNIERGEESRSITALAYESLERTASAEKGV